jgi:hypothetical protein
MALMDRRFRKDGGLPCCTLQERMLASLAYCLSFFVYRLAFMFALTDMRAAKLPDEESYT